MAYAWDMTIPEFLHSLSDAAPPVNAGLALQALWWVGKGDWDRAHGCVQRREGEPACDWVHGHLHRVEGDPGNAGYWYQRAGRPVPTVSTKDEWTDIVEQILSGWQAAQRSRSAP